MLQRPACSVVECVRRMFAVEMCNKLMIVLLVCAVLSSNIMDVHGYSLDSVDYPRDGPVDDMDSSDSIAQDIQLLRQYLRQRALSPPSSASSSSYPSDPAAASPGVDVAYERFRRRGANREWKRGPGSCINSCLGNAMSFVRCKSMCH